MLQQSSEFSANPTTQFASNGQLLAVPMEMTPKKTSLTQATISTGSMGIFMLLFFPRQALAHPGHGLFSFYGGLAHPMTGLDHLLTALALGILAVSATQKINFKIPFAFLAAVLCGIFAGQAGFILPFYEQGIALSLGLLGICLVLGARLVSWKGVALVACFGILHGNAHGAEVENGGLSLSAALGLMLSTGVLLGLGTSSAWIMRKALTDQRTTWILRFFGAGLVGTAFVL